MTDNQILTVSQLNYSVRHQLETTFSYIWLIGEISNLSQPVSGHWYLTLKDSQAQVRCAMFRIKNQRVLFQPRNGMQVLVRANVSLYEPRGDYQVIIETMQPAGDGLLQQQFEQLKNKLAGAGLFAQSHKQPIPPSVRRVGIVSSSSGAALQDILTILRRRDPSLHVVIYPTLVQGKEAAQDIVMMIELANLRQECDVLIVGRGGGSLEDLWCFNEESVAWAIYHSRIPIISAVGHETDVTIADFVADLRAPTPSAAAELVSRNQSELLGQLQYQFNRASLAFDRLWSEKIAYFQQISLRLVAQHPTRQLQQQRVQLEHIQHRLISKIKQCIEQAHQQIQQLGLRLSAHHPERQLVAERHQWNNLQQRLDFSIRQQLVRHQRQFQQLCVQLESLSPLKVLSRGYSVTQNEQGVALIASTEVQIGEKITTRLSQGAIVSKVIAHEG